MHAQDDYDHLREDADTVVKSEELFVTCIACGNDVKPLDALVTSRGIMHIHHQNWEVESEVNPQWFEDFAHAFNKWRNEHPNWEKP